MMRRHLLVVLVLLLLMQAVRAQAIIAGLEKTDKGFKHAGTGTEFIMPDKWRSREPRPMPNGVSVNLYWPSPVISVSLYWIPMENKTLSEVVRTKPEGPNNSYGQEHDNLKAFYGADKIGKPEQIKVGERVVYKIPVATGFDKDGSTVGVLYIFEAWTNPKERWRIRLRGSYPKKDEAEHAKRVEALLGNFK